MFESDEGETERFLIGARFQGTIVRCEARRNARDYAATIDQSAFETYLRLAEQLRVRLECGAGATRSESRSRVLN